MKKVVKLVDGRACRGNTVRELRQIIRWVEEGKTVGVSLVTVQREGGIYVYAENECLVRGLGAVDCLKQHLRDKFSKN